MNTAIISLSGTITTEDFDKLAEMTSHIDTEKPPLQQDVIDYAVLSFEMDSCEEIPAPRTALIEANNLDAVIAVGATDLDEDGPIFIKMRKDGEWLYNDAYDIRQPSLLIPVDQLAHEDVLAEFRDRQIFVRRMEPSLSVA